MKIAGSVILRNMKHAARFTRAAPELTPPLDVELGDDEVLVGWYENVERFSGSVIVFTDEAMTFGTAASNRRLVYADVYKVNFPKKTIDTTHLTLETVHGTVAVVIANSLRGSDAYSLGGALRLLTSTPPDDTPVRPSIAGFPEAIEALRQRPGMCVSDTSYRGLVAYLEGFDAACHYGFLVGLREWLIVELDTGNNLAWPALLEMVADRRSVELSHDFLFDTLAAYWREVRCREGVRKAFARYEQWLLSQSWYR